jgi:hypothetical protein
VYLDGDGGDGVTEAQQRRRATTVAWWLPTTVRRRQGACAALGPGRLPGNAGGARVRWSEKAQREAGAAAPEMAERAAEVADARVAAAEQRGNDDIEERG